MKSLSVLLLVAQVAWACPNLSGVYQMTETHFVKLESKECKSLAIAYGDLERSFGGEMKVKFGPADLYQHDQRSCSLGDCRTTTISDAGVFISMETIWPYASELSSGKPGHGICSFRDRTYSKSGDSLKITFAVFGCEDGYSGDVDEIYPLVK